MDFSSPQVYVAMEGDNGVTHSNGVPATNPSSSPSVPKPRHLPSPQVSMYPRNAFSFILSQYYAIVLKDVLLSLRQVRSTVAQTVISSLGIVILIIFSHVFNGSSPSPSLNDQVNPPATVNPYANYGHCQQLDTNGNPSYSSCITMLYNPSNEFFDGIMEDFTGRLNEAYPSLNLQWGPNGDVRPVQTNANVSEGIQSFILSNLGMVDMAIQFFDFDTITGAALQANQINYLLYYNFTPSAFSSSYLMEQFPLSNYLESFQPLSAAINQRLYITQQILENSMADGIAKNVTKYFPLKGKSKVSPKRESAFPPSVTPPTSSTGIDFQRIAAVYETPYYYQTNNFQQSNSNSPSNDSIALNFVGVFVVLPSCIFFLLLLQLIVREKQDKILMILRLNGLRNSIYVTGSYLHVSIIALTATIIVSIVCAVSGLQTLSHCDYRIYFAFFFVSLSYCGAFAVFMGSVVTQPKWVNLWGFVVVIIAVISCSVVLPNDSVYGNYDSAYGASFFFLTLIPFLPPVKVLADINRNTKVQTVTNTTLLQSIWQPGQAYPSSGVIGYPSQLSYAWSSITNPQLLLQGNCNFDDYTCCNIYEECEMYDSTSFTLGIMVAFSLFYLLLAWYFASCGQGALGGNLPWGFIFDISTYSCGSSSVQAVAPSGDRASDRVVDGDTIERERLLSLEERSIRTVKLSKSFKNAMAVKELTMQMKPNSIYVLLASNGGGKSTTVNLLTATYPPTFGEAFVCGLSVRSSAAEIQSMIGVCPQDNFLFNELTCYQHMEIIGSLRGIQRGQHTLKNAIEHRLKEFQLWDAKSKMVSELSGGMKRRLSCALSLITSPPILLLDEVTTGCDPLNRRAVWETIKMCKKDRVVLYSTHSMEECEYLADEVAFLSNGRLRAQGTLPFLKQRFGKGFQMELLVNNDNTVVQKFVKLVKDFFPNGEIVGSNNGNNGEEGGGNVGSGAITVALRRADLKQLPDFFAEIRKKKLDQAVPAVADGKGSTGLVIAPLREWSISNSSLEEVYLRLCSIEAGINAQVLSYEPEPVNLPRLCVICDKRAASMVTAYTADGLEFVVDNVLCSVCAVKGKEEKGKREEEKKKVEGDTIQFNVDEYKGVEATNGQAALQPLLAPSGGDVVVDPSLSSDDIEMSLNLSSNPQSILSVVGQRPASRSQQILAVVYKHGMIMMSEKWAWTARIVLLILLSLLLLFFGSSFFSASNPGVTTCGAGYSAGNEGSMCPADCTRLSLYSYLFPPTLNEATGAYCAYSYCPQPIDYSNGATGRASLPLGYYLGHNSESNGFLSNLWFVDFTASDSSPINPHFAAFDFGEGPAELYVPGPASTVVAGPTRYNLVTPASMQFIDQGGRAQSVGVTSLQQLVEYDQTVVTNYAQSVYDIRPTAVVNCMNSLGYYTGATVPVIAPTNSVQQAYNISYNMFPDAGIEVFQAQMGYWMDNGDSWSRSQFQYRLLYPVAAEYEFPYGIAYYPIGFENNSFGVQQSCYALPVPALSEVTYTIASTIHLLANSLLWTNIDNQANLTSLYEDIGLAPENGPYTYNLYGALPRIQTSIQFIAPLQFYPAISLFNRVMSLWILVLGSSMVFPWICDRLLYEREHKLFYLQRLNGLESHMYYLSNYVADSIILWVNSLFFIIVGYALKLNGFSNTNGGVVFLVFLVWIHSEVCMALFVASLFSTRRLASICSYIGVGILVSYGALMETFVAPLSFPSDLIFFPPFAFVRLLSIMVNYGGSSLAEMGPSTLSISFAAILGWLFSCATILGVLGMAINFCREESVEILLREVARVTTTYYKKLKGDNVLKEESDRLQSDEDDSSDVDNGEWDEDVISEKNRLKQYFDLNLKGPSNPFAVAILNLCKHYPMANTKDSVFKAVKNLYFGVGYNEIFGLLGPNGAGKSTTISVLSGLITSTSGKVFVCGHNVNSDLRSVYNYIGICPQHDALWDDLTIRQHLRFYARLKGCPSKYERALVQKIAEMVEVDGDSFDKAASTLSGGQRRRLSIGISLISSPKLWLLDEPSTGLSVEIQRDLWNIIAKASKGRATILTSHNMNEVSCLASRIGIMVEGQLRCIGDQPHLKDKFGSGFKLTLNLTFEYSESMPGHREKMKRIEDFVGQNLWPGAVLATEAIKNFSRNVIFRKPLKEGRQENGGSEYLTEILGLFNRLELNRHKLLKEFSVAEYSISNSTMEEIFVAVVEKHQKDWDAIGRE